MRGQIDTSQHWCVLRVGGGRTLVLATSLASAGYEVWTPSRTQNRMVPRSKVRREIMVPIMPTFVFARADRLADLMVLAAAPVKEQPAFSVFRHYSKIPLIADGALEALRTAERRAVPAGKRLAFKAGANVRVPEGSFGGMSGVVEDSQGQFTLVCFPGWRVPVKIDTFLLRPNEQ